MLLRRIAPVESAPLELVDLPMPEPGPGEVRIRVRCCAVCRTDLHVIEGDLPQQKLPIIPGHQIVGIVDKMGKAEGGRAEGGGNAAASWPAGGRGLAAAHVRPVRLLHVGPREPLRVGPLHRLPRRRRLCRVCRGAGRVRLRIARGVQRRRGRAAACARASSAIGPCGGAICRRAESWPCTASARRPTW